MLKPVFFRRYHCAARKYVLAMMTHNGITQKNGIVVFTLKSFRSLIVFDSRLAVSSIKARRGFLRGAPCLPTPYRFDAVAPGVGTCSSRFGLPVPAPMK